MQYGRPPKHAGPLNRKERRRLKVHLAADLDRHLATRKCGECTACCTTLTVEDLDKPAGLTCCHARGAGGCGIYATRPKACREYECGWRIGIGSDDERPDRVGVTLSPLAPGMPGHPGFIAHELWPNAFDETAEYLARVAQGSVVILVRGDFAVRILMPEDRGPGMKADLARIQQMNAEVRAAKSNALGE